MNNRKLEVCTSLAAVVFIVALLEAARKPAPVDLTLADLDGRKVHLKDLRGKVVVLNFWATWCGPCKEEMPLLVELEKVWKPKGVTFVGVSLDERETRKNIPAFLNRFQVTYPVWIGATVDDLAKLGLGEAVPDTAFIDEEGFIFARVLGEIREAEMEERLKWITGGRSGPAPAPRVTHLP